MNFAYNLKNLRESKAITQEELAKHLKVSRPTIAGYESRNRQPDFDKLEKISSFFNVSIDYLILGEECSIDINTRKKNADTNLAYKIALAGKQLSAESQQDLLNYIELLQLRDRKREKEAKKKQGI